MCCTSVDRAHLPAPLVRFEHHDRIAAIDLTPGLVADLADVEVGVPGEDADVLDVGHWLAAGAEVGGQSPPLQYITILSYFCMRVIF